jgi:hypothetical protein
VPKLNWQTGHAKRDWGQDTEDRMRDKDLFNCSPRLIPSSSSEESSVFIHFISRDDGNNFLYFSSNSQPLEMDEKGGRGNICVDFISYDIGLSLAYFLLAQ